MNFPRYVQDLRRRQSWHALTLGLIALALLAGPVLADKKPPFKARGGLAVSQSAARAWANDAILVYIENDESIDATGAAERWGYLYYSPGTAETRVYSVREGKILVAEYLEMKFDAPPVTPDWIDSGEAYAVAEEMAGRSFCQLNQGKLDTMLLMRGAFNSGDPDQTTWTLIYTSPSAPSLFVVVDAKDGKVRRTWRD
jgi:hypothetical protein